MIAHRFVGKQTVEPLGITTKEHAKKGGDRHGYQHVSRGFLWTKSRVFGKKREEWNLNPCLVENSRRGEK